MTNSERIIGVFQGKAPGPLLICVGGMHGNELAGVRALEAVFHMLEAEPQKNPGFSFRGKIVGLKGNLQALACEQRFIEKDLNRQWTRENVKKIRSQKPSELSAEDLELHEILKFVEREVREYAPQEVIFLDLHTTTAAGGIFSVPANDGKSVDIALKLHAPVIKGMLRGLEGTTLHFFSTANLGIPTRSLAFESGQHNDPLSVNRAISAVINCLRTVGCVSPSDVENRHDELLIAFSQGLPRLAELIVVQRILPEDQFRMLPGYKNFQRVKRGEHLANNSGKKILAKEDGLILMPLYQNQGNDGFFLIKELQVP